MLNLKVTIDNNSGFCFGVVYAIQMAEDFLEEQGSLYCLGDIVHNDEEVSRLEKKGLVTITHEDLHSMKDVTVLIRAHGESPDTYKTALENNITLIDASCPVVLKLQHRVREGYEVSNDAPILIYGKHGHAEVKGLLGQTSGEAIVFQDYSEIADKALPPKVQLFSQTTKDTRKLYEIRDKLKDRGIEVIFNDTICRQVSNRDTQLQTFAKQYDKIVFVSGKKSSNGLVLYNVCKEHNPNTFFVSSVEDINKDWFHENDTVGIAGATSTPQWLMEEIKNQIETY